MLLIVLGHQEDMKGYHLLKSHKIAQCKICKIKRINKAKKNKSLIINKNKNYKTSKSNNLVLIFNVRKIKRKIQVKIFETKS